MALHCAFDNGQPQAGTRDVAYIIGAVKIAKQTRQFIWRYAYALVLHLKHQTVCISAHRETNALPAGAVFDGIGQQVAQNVAQQFFVSRAPCRRPVPASAQEPFGSSSESSAI
jgi:hypothetical protein